MTNDEPGFENGERVLKVAEVCIDDVGDGIIEKALADLSGSLEYNYGPDFKAEIQERIKAAAMEIASDRVARVFAAVMDSQNPSLLIDQIASAFGFYLRFGTSDTQLAIKHGVTRQDFQQGKKRFVESLNKTSNRKIRKARNMKSNTENYAKRNFRKVTHDK